MCPPWDGSGNFNRSFPAGGWQGDAAAGIKILASRHDTHDADLAAGLSNCIAKDGQSSPTANIGFNGKKITNLANPVDPQDAATKNYADNIRTFGSGTTWTGTSTGTSPNYTSTAFIGFAEADLSIVARKADPTVTPPTVDRLMLNSTANGTGPDIGPLATQTALERNRIVNGAMQISQETAKGTDMTAAGGYAADQWAELHSVTAGAPIYACFAATASAPNLIRLNSTTANASPGAGDYYLLLQYVEGIRLTDFLWGTAAAKQVVLRFDAKSNFAGTFGVSIRNGTAANRSFVKNIAIPGDSIFRTYTVVIPGDTTGTWAIDNSRALNVYFCAMTGTTNIGVEGWQAGAKFASPGVSNWMSVAGQVLDITNVGLYLDPDNTGIPPKWEMPDEAQELRACMRYCQFMRMDTSDYAPVANAYMTVTQIFPIPMRVAPAVTNTAAGAPINLSTGIWDTLTSISARVFIQGVAAGPYGVNGRIGFFSARM